MDYKLEIKKLKTWLLNFYTMAQISEHCGIKQGTLYGYLNGTKKSSESLQIKLLEKLKEMKEAILKGAK